MKINRKHTVSIENTKMIYYKCEIYLNTYENEITIEHSTYSWGHGSEKCDEMYYDGRTTCIFKTKNKENMPDNIEELLIEHLFFGLKETIEVRKNEIAKIVDDMNKTEKLFELDIFKNINRKIKLESL